MKRFTFFGFLLVFVFSSVSTIQAQDTNTTDPLCGMTTPASCFYVISESGERFKGRNPEEPLLPKHCPNSGIRGLRDDEVLHPLYTEFSVDETLDSIQKMKLLQERLSQTDCSENQSCAPLGQSIKENPDDDIAITCSNNTTDFSDGKYGVCTAEAVRRYLTWYKVEYCNTNPTLTITIPQEATQGEKIIAKITSAGGTVYKLNEELFKAEKVDPIKLENIVLKSSDENVHTTLPKKVELNTDIPLTFSSTGTTNLSVSGTVVGKPNMKKVISNDATITIKSSPSSTSKTNNELGCNQLLPKYLVGASCNTELKGDARDITYWLQKFSGQITTFVAAIAVLLIAWNAFGLVMAAGDSDQLANGKRALMWVGIGLLLTVFAYVIIKTALSLTFLQ